MKKKLLILLFFIFTVLSYGEVSDIGKLENKIFGYNYENNKSVLERVEQLEYVVIGDTAEGNVFERINKMNQLIEKSGEYSSIEEKVAIIENFLFKKIETKKPILLRIETVEDFLFKKITNGVGLSQRLGTIYNFLFINRGEVLVETINFKKRAVLRIKPLFTKEDLKFKEKMYFEITKDSPGVAKRGSKVVAEIISTGEESGKSYGLFIIETLINEENKEIIIYKKVKVYFERENFENGFEVEEVGIIG